MPRRDYGADYGLHPGAYNPHAGWLPGAYMVDAPMYGWGWWGGAWGWPTPGVNTYGYDQAEYGRDRPVDPRESGSFGREGDRMARRWAERYGYDVEMSIRPRRQMRGGPGYSGYGPRRGRYDRGY
jgi:hypothetical protein